MNTFRIRGSEIELYKLLKASGLAETGGQAKLAIEEGRVSVNGAVEMSKACRIRPGDKVEFEGTVIAVEDSGG